MYAVNDYIACLFVQGTAEKQLADAVSLVKKLDLCSYRVILRAFKFAKVSINCE